MMKSIIVGLVLVLLLPAPALAQQQVDGVITGQVTNDTEGGVIGGIEVTLITYIDNMLADSRTSITDSDGVFIFDNVDIEHTYLVSARYQDVDYYYQVVF
jgi:hypothetical protein